jgi:hypothetical protein
MLSRARREAVLHRCRLVSWRSPCRFRSPLTFVSSGRTELLARSPQGGPPQPVEGRPMLCHSVSCCHGGAGLWREGVARRHRLARWLKSGYLVVDPASRLTVSVGADLTCWHSQVHRRTVQGHAVWGLVDGTTIGSSPFGAPRYRPRLYSWAFSVPTGGSLAMLWSPFVPATISGLWRAGPWLAATS